MNPLGFPLEQLFILPVSIFAFIVLLTIIVFFHEYGHFSAARLLGVRVDVFSIGFGKPILTWIDRKGTEWRISRLPFGGYVKFFGDASAASTPSRDVIEEQAAGTDEDAPRAALTTQFPRPGDGDAVGAAMTAEERAVCFHFKPVWARAIIVAAGPIANFVLATAIFWALLMSLGTYVTEARVGQVVAGSAAEEAGFLPGDAILRANERRIVAFDDLRSITMLSAGETIAFEVDRNGETLVIEATPRRQEVDDAFGNKVTTGVLGVIADGDTTEFVRYGPWPALKAAMKEVADIIGATLKFLSRLVVGKEDKRQLGGPIKMAQYAGQSAVSGFSEEASGFSAFVDSLKISLINFINLAAVVSVSIGFLNLLPIPVLDGGHLLYYAYETIAGKPLGARAQAVGFQVGLILLASFMLFVTWNDVSNLLSSLS
ncbi:MAG: RIP metalloprotease [Pseudomonadota bacterium]